MKAIRCDNDCRELMTGRELDEKKEKKMANYGKMSMTQPKAGVEEMCQWSENGAARYLSFPTGRARLPALLPA